MHYCFCTGTAESAFFLHISLDFTYNPIGLQTASNCLIIKPLEPLVKKYVISIPVTSVPKVDTLYSPKCLFPFLFKLYNTICDSAAMNKPGPYIATFL